MPSISRPRGTRDLYGEGLARRRRVLAACAASAGLAGYAELQLPTFERAELFRRQNENSDVVQKELYEFSDRGGRALALRPEATASVVRCAAENGMLRPETLPLRAFLAGPMFRYERPQGGRDREFWQFDVETLGGDPVYETAATVALGNRTLAALGIRNVRLDVNFIGSFASRANWVDALRSHLEPHRSELSALSQRRLDANPLRILDDKVDGALACVRAAPKIADFLSNEEKAAFARTLGLLREFGVNANVNPLLVRGLDYYVDVVFEFVLPGPDGTEQTIAAGGQYDGLVKELAGTDLRGVGMAFGVDRCAAALDPEAEPEWSERLTLFAVSGASADRTAALRERLLDAGLPVSFSPDATDVRKALRQCARDKCRYAAIVGGREEAAGTATVKDLRTESQRQIALADLPDWWKNREESL